MSIIDKPIVKTLMLKGEKGEVSQAQLDEVKAQVNSLASGSPLVASSTSEMTDTTRVYVNTTDGKWYYYDGDSWEIGGTYQSTQLGDNTVTFDKLGYDVIYNLNSRINNVEAIRQNDNKQLINLTGNLDNKNINNGEVLPTTISTRVCTPNTIYIPDNSYIDIDKNTDNYSIEVSYYDKDFNYISQFTISYKKVMFMPNSIKYVRFKFVKANNTQDITPTEVLNNVSLSLKRTVKNNIYNVGNNLFNKDEYYASGLISSGHYSLDPSASYNTSKPIRLDKNQAYSISRFRKLALYDLDFNYIDNSYIDTDTNNYTFTPTIDCYLLFSYGISYANTIMVNKGFSVLTYEDYKLYLPSNVVINETVDKSDNVLYGKKLVTCGDSFTAYTNATFDSGRFSGQNKTYPYLIALRNDMELQQLAVSGSTISYNGGDQMQFSDSTYQTIDSDADYILLKYGINDMHQAIEIGNINDNTNTTFYGAWNIVLSYIIEHYPTAKIGIIVTNGLEIDTSSENNSPYANAIINVAKKYGIPTLNEWNDPNVPLLLRTGRTDIDISIRNMRRDTFRVSAENTHENYICQEYEATFIEDFLRRL